jgi:hypothetical protein
VKQSIIIVLLFGGIAQTNHLSVFIIFGNYLQNISIKSSESTSKLKPSDLTVVKPYITTKAHHHTNKKYHQKTTETTNLVHLQTISK